MCSASLCTDLGFIGMTRNEGQNFERNFKNSSENLNSDVRPINNNSSNFQLPSTSPSSNNNSSSNSNNNVDNENIATGSCFLPETSQSTPVVLANLERASSSYSSLPNQSYSESDELYTKPFNSVSDFRDTFQNNIAAAFGSGDLLGQPMYGQHHRSFLEDLNQSPHPPSRDGSNKPSVDQFPLFNNFSPFDSLPHSQEQFNQKSSDMHDSSKSDLKSGFAYGTTFYAPRNNFSDDLTSGIQNPWNCQQPQAFPNSFFNFSQPPNPSNQMFQPQFRYQTSLSQSFGDAAKKLNYQSQPIYPGYRFALESFENSDVANSRKPPSLGDQGQGQSPSHGIKKFNLQPKVRASRNSITPINNFPPISNSFQSQGLNNLPYHSGLTKVTGEGQFDQSFPNSAFASYQRPLQFESGSLANSYDRSNDLYPTLFTAPSFPSPFQSYPSHNPFGRPQQTHHPPGPDPHQQTSFDYTLSHNFPNSEPSPSNSANQELVKGRSNSFTDKICEKQIGNSAESYGKSFPGKSYPESFIQPPLLPPHHHQMPMTQSPPTFQSDSIYHNNQDNHHHHHHHQHQQQQQHHHHHQQQQHNSYQINSTSMTSKSLDDSLSVNRCTTDNIDDNNNSHHHHNNNSNNSNNDIHKSDRLNFESSLSSSDSLRGTGKSFQLGRYTYRADQTSEQEEKYHSQGDEEDGEGKENKRCIDDMVGLMPTSREVDDDDNNSSRSGSRASSPASTTLSCENVSGQSPTVKNGKLQPTPSYPWMSIVG